MFKCFSSELFVFILYIVLILGIKTGIHTLPRCSKILLNILYIVYCMDILYIEYIKYNNQTKVKKERKKKKIHLPSKEKKKK